MGADWSVSDPRFLARSQQPQGPDELDAAPASTRKEAALTSWPDSVVATFHYLLQTARPTSGKMKPRQVRDLIKVAQVCVTQDPDPSWTGVF